MAKQLSFEDVKIIATDLVQCAANLRITNRIDEIYTRITSAVEIHLNIGQSCTVDTKSVFFSLENLRSTSINNKHLKLENEILVEFSLKTIVEPQAVRGDGLGSIFNNLSRSLSLSFYDQNKNEIPLPTHRKFPMEFFISRDPNLDVPPMIRQNVTKTNLTSDSFPFKLHLVDLAKIQPNADLTVSLHIEINPLHTSIAYLFIFKMDRSPRRDRLGHDADGWTIFCPSSAYRAFLVFFFLLFSDLDLTKDDLYTYYIDNQRTRGRQSVIFGLRELNSDEFRDLCSDRWTKTHLPLSKEFFSFSFDYRLRTYLSGCYYLDENNHWQSDGLLVSDKQDDGISRTLLSHSFRLVH